MTDECSILSYKTLVESGYVGRRQAQYLHIFILAEKPLTHAEASGRVDKEFGTRVPARNGRIAELEAMGFLRKVDRVTSVQSGHLVNRWEWTGAKEPNPIPRPDQKVATWSAGGMKSITVDQWAKEHGYIDGKKVLCAWLIWSVEHRGYWKPGSNGYTEDIQQAGIFDFSEALRICDNANTFSSQCYPSELMTPAYVLLDFLKKQ